MDDRPARHVSGHDHGGDLGPDMAPTATAGTGFTSDWSRQVPLSLRILTQLPGPGRAWVAAWALVPWLNLAVIVATHASPWTQSGVPAAETLNRAAVSFAVLLSLWGTAKITDELQELPHGLANVVNQHESVVARLFRGIDNIYIPLLITAALCVVLPLDEALRGERLAAVIQAATWALIGIPLSTALWVYFVLQVGLSRLGRGHLVLKGYRGDRSLGLRPVGRLAFTGFWMLFGTVAPLVVTGFTDLPGVVIGIGVLVVGIGLFFASLQGMHRQMAAVKQRELDNALDLYQQAYDQVREQPTLEVLERQVGLLSAAETLENRAERIQEWPFDEAIFARVVTIASGVAGVIIARLLLAPIGL
jgi:hypothetical protein